MLQPFIHQILCFVVLVIIFASFIVDLFVCNNVYSGVIKNCMWDVSQPDIHIFFPHRFVDVGGVGSDWVFRLFTSIDCFAWYKISLKFFAQNFFCWLFTCVYHIYWNSVHWSWNASSNVLSNCYWAISKPAIYICFRHRFVEGTGEGAIFVFTLGAIITLIGFKLVAQVDQFFGCVGKCLPKGYQVPLGSFL